jgi:hypothetical protein
MAASRGTPGQLALGLVTFKHTKTINSRNIPFFAAVLFRADDFGEPNSPKVLDFLTRQLHKSGIAIWVKGVSLWIEDTVVVYECLIALKDTRLEPFLATFDYFHAIILDGRIGLNACRSFGFGHDWWKW